MANGFLLLLLFLTKHRVELKKKTEIQNKQTNELLEERFFDIRICFIVVVVDLLFTNLFC